MARLPRIDVGDNLYHIINRANARLPIFFEEEYSMRILAYCLMPNHFHLVVYPHDDGDVQKFMQWVTLTHTQRWHIKNKTVGSGHLYQGRYKSFLIEKDNHLLSVIRYVERNPLRARLVKKAENWNFSSLACRLSKDVDRGKILSLWPIQEPKDYLSFVNQELNDEEELAVHYSVLHGKPFGSGKWIDDMITKYNLGATVREKGRPKKGT
ncbi:MAG: transposase [Candidatus Taylorbacteria bacterium]|nr:transposase [Candidatus Taylorbacteria bacterium]